MIIYRTINDVYFGVNPEKPAGLICDAKIAEMIHGSIYELVEYLYEAGGRYTPMLATWEITNACNFKCPFCYINTSNSKKITQSMDALKEKIDDLVDAGLLLVYLTGGEVLSVPDFEDIYLYLKMKGVFIVILSNLSLLNDSHIELFLRYPPLRVTASVYGVNEDQFSYITGQPGDVMRKVLDNILHLKNLGINVTCQMPVNRITEKDYRRVSEWCCANDIVFKSNNELTNSYYGDDYQEAYIADEEFRSLKNADITESGNDTLQYEIEKADFGYRYYFDCVSGKHTFAISYNNHIRPCFNIWESDCEWFDGNASMHQALFDMMQYIEKKRGEIVTGCTGCYAHSVCGECDYTKIKYRDKQNSDMKKRCIENNKRLIIK